MIGELAEKQDVLHHYKTPVPVKVPVSEYRKSEFFGELSFKVVLDEEETFIGVVPLYVFDDDDQTIEGMAIGEQDDNVVVYFAPTQNGRTTLILPERMLTKAR